MAALVTTDLSGKADDSEAAIRTATEALGFEYVDPNDLPDDPVLIALQGRRGDDPGATLDGIGLGAAAVFGPEEIPPLAAALNNLDEPWLRSRFDLQEIDTLMLPADDEEEELDEYFLPLLSSLKTLYARAVSARQHVVVVAA